MRNNIFNIQSITLPLLFIGLLLFANSNAFAYTITSATLSGPACISCPPDGNKATYSINLTGTGQSASVASWLIFSVYDNDWWVDPDDLLQNEILFSILGDGTPAGNWTKLLTFDLECADGCEVTGKDGSSWETTSAVYALIESSWGSDLIYTNLLNVSCKVPEPASLVLFMVGLLGIARLHRKSVAV